MRGTPPLMKNQRFEVRIIPAHAGNTRWIGNHRIIRRDHPRACGEHRFWTRNTLISCGSSPRMRGTRNRHEEPERHHGIIPAHAGNTHIIRRNNRLSGDHPRACGEHQPKIINERLSQGSSPRMRGTLVSIRFYLCIVGIIPAHAGNTHGP